MKEKLKKMLLNSNTHIILITLAFFLIFNLFFQIKYEQVDDLGIMNLISGSDGHYSIYGVFIHPVLCTIILLLFKTGININWYSIVLLVIQFISFTIIGIVLTKKSKKLGIFLYIIFMLIYYSKMLYYLQYTSIAALAMTAGILAILYFIDNMENNKKFFITGIIFVVIGTMLRQKSIIITLPFLILYVLYYIIINKKKIYIKYLCITIISIMLVFATHYAIYNCNPIYNYYLKFCDLQSYFLDFNSISYEGNEELFQKVGWTANDVDVFYTYSFADENVYNVNTLQTLKDNLNKQDDIGILKRIENTLIQFIKEANDIYKIPVIFLLLITIFCFINHKDKILVLFVLLLTFGLHCGFIFIERQMFRVVISSYIVGSAIMLYLLPIKNEKESKKYFYTKLITTILLSIFSVSIIKDMYIQASMYDKENYKIYKEVIEYANNNKENVYLFTVLLRDRFLAYSVYEKIPDNTYSNLRQLGGWDNFTQNYYNFKDDYEIDNIIKALYEKDNVYLITGKVTWGKVYNNYIDIIVQYIKDHYNVDTYYEIVKEFNQDIKIYKLKQI